MRRGRKSGRYRRGASRRCISSVSVNSQNVADDDNCRDECSSFFISGDDASCDFEGFDTSSLAVEYNIEGEQSSAPEIAWDTFPDSIDMGFVKNESPNCSTDSFETLHEPLLFESEIQVPSEADQKSWEAVFGDHDQLAALVTPSVPATSTDQLVVSTTRLKPSLPAVGRVSVSLKRLKDEDSKTWTQNFDSSEAPISRENLKIREAAKHRPRGRGRGRGRGKTKLVRPVKACKKEILDDKEDQPIGPAPVPGNVPDSRSAVASPIPPPAKRHRCALKFRERPEPFAMDPGYLRDLKYMESLRPKNLKEEHELLNKLNIIYDRLGTDNFPHLLHGLRRKLIVRKEQRESGLPVFDLDAIENFLSANGRVPTNEERLRMEFVKAAVSGGEP